MLRYLYSILALLTLSACGGIATSSTLDGVISDRLTTSAARWTVASRLDRRRTWLSPEVALARSPLLFVSDSGTADVYLYKLPSLKVVGTITGFSQPQGECSDNKGNVWVTDTNAQTIYELSHRGLLENALSDSSGFPDACAWDATTGNLAVMSLFGTDGVSGAVLVYPPGSSTPAEYSNPKQYYYNFGGYDGTGDLFFDGRDQSGNFILSELAKGASTAKTIPLTGGTVYFPGMVQWDRTKGDLIVGDQSCGGSYVSCVYLIKVGSKGGTIVGTIQLKGYTGSPVCDLVQGVQFGKQIAGSDNDFCGYTPSTTYVWAYPGGKAPLHYNNATDSTPVGAAVSL
jgi:hypothetical protein